MHLKGPLKQTTHDKVQNAHTFAIGALMVPALSPFHSLVPFSFRRKPEIFAVTVPRRSDGMRPRGPSTRPSFGVIARMRSGVHRNIEAWCRPLMICMTSQRQSVNTRSPG